MKKADVTYKNMMERLKEICNQRKITYYFLAKATGLSPSSISCLMRGKAKPNLYTVLMICDAMDISLEDLIQNGGENENAEERCLIKTFRQLSPEKRRLLKIYVKMLREYTGVI